MGEQCDESGKLFFGRSHSWNVSQNYTRALKSCWTTFQGPLQCSLPPLLRRGKDWSWETGRGGGGEEEEERRRRRKIQLQKQKEVQAVAQVCLKHRSIVDCVLFLSSCSLLLCESRLLLLYSCSSLHSTYKMVNPSPADAVPLEPTYNLCEDPFVLLTCLDTLECQTQHDLSCLLCIVKAARTLDQVHHKNNSAEHMHEEGPTSSPQLNWGLSTAFVCISFMWKAWQLLLNPNLHLSQLNPYTSCKWLQMKKNVRQQLYNPMW